VDDSEFSQLLRLIKRFADTNLDQWAMWKIENDPNPIDVTIAYGPWHGSEDHHYTA
jgi:hypothetical protein